jgi:excisionase family DNA binding protein
MEKTTQKKKLLSIGKAADYINVSIDTLRRWEKKGKVDSYRSPGNHRYFLKEDLDKLFGKKYQHDTPRKKRKEKKVADESMVSENTQEWNSEKTENENEFEKEIPKITPTYAPPTVYPTFTPSKTDEIIDRPVREVKVPEIELIRVVRKQRRVEFTNGNFKRESEQSSQSILTPKFEEPNQQESTSKEKDIEIEEEKTKEESKAKFEKTDSKKRDATKQKERNEDSKIVKNNLLIYAIITVTILIVIATIFFVIGITSQQMISPVP